jgi:hypothetical protein
MKIINNSENALCHGLPSQTNKCFYRVEVGKVLDVPKEVAKLWLKIKGVEEYAAPSDVKKAEAKVKELEAKLKELEAPKKKPAKKGSKK